MEVQNLLKTAVLITAFCMLSAYGCHEEPHLPWEPVIDFPEEEQYILKYLDLKDIHGTYYKTVRIGGQTWMAENLKVTKYQNGDDIAQTSKPNVSGDIEPKYAWLNPEAVFRGRHYTYYVASDERNVCPTGWHVPTKNDFGDFRKHLIQQNWQFGSSEVAFDKGNDDWDYMAADLSEKGTWDNSEIEYTPGGAGEHNRTNFSALSTGYRSAAQEVIQDLGAATGYWASNLDGNGNAYVFSIQYDETSTKDLDNLGNSFKKNGFSIRCLKD